MPARRVVRRWLSGRWITGRWVTGPRALVLAVLLVIGGGTLIWVSLA